MTNSGSPIEIAVYGSSDDYWASIVSNRCSNVEISTVKQIRARGASLANVTGLIGWHFPTDLFSQMPELRWIQFISVGVDEWTENELISPHVVVTNTKGLYADSVADYIMWSLLTMTRKFDVILRAQAKRRWHQVSGPSLKDKTMGIIGVGNVGCALAKRAAAFEIKTIGIVSERANETQEKLVDEIIPVGDLKKVIGELDILAICVPLTTVTKRLLDSDMIANMKPGAYLINSSRGEIVDNGAVVAALNSDKLAGAAMDVFDKEPLSRWDSLWKTRNLLITPHIAAITDEYRNRVGELICQNVDSFSSGMQLLNVVDPKKGY